MRKTSPRFEQGEIIKHVLAEVEKLMQDLLIAHELSASNMTQLEALVRIAEKNNSIVNVAEARRILLLAGLMSEKNSPTIFHTVITRSGKFEAVNRGQYWLVEDSETTKEAPAQFAYA
jgi:hypothetical protein